MSSTYYRVYITPRESNFVYGDEIEVSAEILYNGIKSMKKSIDASDYELGVYTYGDISLKLINKEGLYSFGVDNRSIFTYSRDLAKVRVVYVDTDGEVTRFRGLINDEATKQDLEREEITFRVLSNDSVIRSEQVAGGLIADGVLASDAIKSILNQARITSVLNYSESNITVDQDFTVDVGSEFDNQNARDALNDLLFATNSVLLIDSSDNMIVQSRDATATNILALYGPFDEKNRQNVLSVKKLNPGKHRMFNAVKINNTEETDSGYITDFGYRQFAKDLSFITTTATETTIAEKILEDFREAQIECEVEVPTHVAKDADLLDPVSLNYPLRIKRYNENVFLPIVGVTEIGDANMPLPYALGGLSISPNVAFKIIEISENPKDFTTTLKLRQYGFFAADIVARVGFAVIGTSVIADTGDTNDKWTPAYIGGARLGSTKIG